MASGRADGASRMSSVRGFVVCVWSSSMSIRNKHRKDDP